MPRGMRDRQRAGRRGGRVRSIVGGLVAGLGYAALSVLAFPGIGLWAFALVAPLPLIALRPSMGLSWVAFGVWLGVMPFWLWTHIWVGSVSAAGLPPLIMLQSVWAALFVVLHTAIGRSWPSVPLAARAAVCWGAVELFRGAIAFDGYPWYLAAHPLINAWWISAAGATVGAYGLGMLVAGLCGASLSGVRTLGVAAAVWAVLSLPGVLATPVEGPSVRVGVVQTNVAQSVRGGWPPEDRVVTMGVLDRWTRDATALGSDLVVWPETMFPGEVIEPDAVQAQVDAELIWFLPDSAAAQARELGLNVLRDNNGRAAIWAAAPVAWLEWLSESTGVPLLVGAAAHDGYRIIEDDVGIRDEADARFNSAYLFEGGDASQARYDKIRLTPFGEVMPYISAWDTLEELLLSFGARGMAFDVESGANPVGFSLETTGGVVRVISPICFEATSPGVVRGLLAGSEHLGTPTLIAQITNDGWFGRTDRGREAHAQASRWRALELGLPMIRAANTGISRAYDARGRELAPEAGEGLIAGEARSEGLVAFDLAIDTRGTPQRWLGEWPSRGALALATGGLALGWIRKRGQR
ncbi:MAG: apolipoprotein N-acyltransferase [Planctomycetota bacterium]